MYIRKRSFFEILIPLMALAFLGSGTRFIDVTHLPETRYVFLFITFFYLFLNRKIFAYIGNKSWIFLLLVYLLFCISTSLWSEIFTLSFLKSVAFFFAIVTSLSAGCFWVIKFGYRNSFEWLFPVLIMTLISGICGGKANDQIGNVILYSGLSWNPNNFGFLTVIVLPLILWRCYCFKSNKKALLFWIVLLILDLKFLFSSYSRSSIANFLCVVLFFVLSLPLSKKILLSFASIFSLILILVMMPISFLESMAMNQILKGQDAIMHASFADRMLHSREEAWQQSYNDAMRGGMLGAGFAVSVGDSKYKVGQALYGREKGNAQLAILEETGVIGLLLSSLVIFMFFIYAFPYYIQLSGDKKVMFGLVLGSLCGLLAESLVEAWWDSLAAEVICFWMLIGVVFGMIYLEKQGRLT